ncbi:hypothetical protein NMY22_g11893 [Coprinellus aureogranulatus]|nr:hypothetical protein NMY22_g11893 [Coprinellus aureogranulatus]
MSLSSTLALSFRHFKQLYKLFIATGMSGSPAPTTIPIYDAYAKRSAPGGAYIDLANKIASANGHKAFLASGALRIGRDFTPKYTRATETGGWDKTVLEWTDSAFGEGEAEVLLFGQTTCKALGMKLGAKGNHYGKVDSEGNFQRIKDNSHVKPVIVLCEPTKGGYILDTAWANQWSALNEIHETLAREDHNKGLRHIVSMAPGSNSQRLVRVSGQAIYRNLGNNAGSTATSREPPTTHGITKITPEMVKKPDVFKKDMDSHQSRGSPPGTPGNFDPRTAVVYEGATYPLDCLADHRGPLFDQHNSVVLQPRIYDSNKRLVAPWDVAEKLKPGVLVVVQGTMSVWKTGDSKPVLPAVQRHQDQDPRRLRRGS